MTDQHDRELPHQLLPKKVGPVTAGVISLLLYSSLLGLPLLGVLVAPFSALPVLMVRASGGSEIVAWGWPTVLIASLAWLGWGAAGAALMLGYLVLVGLPVTTVGWWERAGWTEGRWAAVTVLLGVVILLGFTAAVSWPADPLTASAGWVRAIGNDAAEMYQELGMSRGRVELMLDRSQRTVPWILPAIAAAYLVFTVFTVRPRCRLIGVPVTTRPFEEYANDEWLPAAFAVSGAAVLLGGGVLKWAAANVLAAVLILYFVQGLAIIRAHAARFVGRGWLVRWGLALLAVQVPFLFLVMILGLVDSFRSLRPSGPSDNGRTNG